MSPSHRHGNLVKALIKKKKKSSFSENFSHSFVLPNSVPWFPKFLMVSPTCHLCSPYRDKRVRLGRGWPYLQLVPRYFWCLLIKSGANHSKFKQLVTSYRNLKFCHSLIWSTLFLLTLPYHSFRQLHGINFFKKRAHNSCAFSITTT